MVSDPYGRPVLNLRIAVTQRCNLRCPYCHREGETSSVSREMSPDEISKIVEVVANLGVSKVKLTGGEPLLREDLHEIVQGIAGVGGLTDLAMTTNGTLLAEKAMLLRKSGLRRININFPSLKPERYREITGGNLEDLISGVEAAVQAGFYPIKLNMVLLHGINQDEIGDMISFSRGMGVILQLIELESVNVGADYFSQRHYPLTEVEMRLRKRALRVETRRHMQGRRVYHLPDVKVEVVNPLENTEFCLRCTRLRVTSDGKFKPCLMRDDNLVDFLSPMRNGADDETLTRLFGEAVSRREPFYKEDF